MFYEYPKVHRLGHEDCDGILEGECYIQEKIDGANASIWLEDGRIRVGSRNNDISNTDSLNGFHEYVMGHEGLQTMVRNLPNCRFYGEWLLRHSIQYDETAYREFYLFDIFEDVVEGDEKSFNCEKRWSPKEVQIIAAIYSVKSPTIFATLDNPSLETLKSFLGQSVLGNEGEGIVIKNMEFTNKWGRHVYAKLVTEDFREKNAIIFGGNSKHSENYWEQYIVNQFMTVARIRKVVQKIASLTGGKAELSWTPRVAGTAYHDMLEEEIWTIAKKCGKVDFKVLSRIAHKKAQIIFKDVLSNDLSVAYA